MTITRTTPKPLSRGFRTGRPLLTVPTLTAMVTSLAALLASASHAETVGIDFTGPGVSGHIRLTYGSTTDAKYSQAFEVTGISGSFSDSNNGLNIVNATITGLAPLNIASPEPTNLLAPANFSKFSFTPLPTLFPDFSYDNLFWPNGSVQTATDYPTFGGFVDIYGLLFTIDGGYHVNFWSNGDSGSGVDYGVGVATASQEYDYVSGSVTAVVFPVPEIDPAGVGSVLALLGGALGLLERRRMKLA